MAILRTTYNMYLPELQKAKQRIKRDRLICKLINDMINNKKLSNNNQSKLIELIASSNN